MKDRRIWVIISCILVVGIAITSYTSSVVKKSHRNRKYRFFLRPRLKQQWIVTLRLCRQSPGSTGKMKAGDPEQTEAAGAGIRSEKETEARTAEETEESNSSEDQVQVRRQILRMKVWSRFYMMQNRNRKAIQTA